VRAYRDCVEEDVTDRANTQKEQDAAERYSPDKPSKVPNKTMPTSKKSPAQRATTDFIDSFMHQLGQWDGQKPNELLAYFKKAYIDRVPVSETGRTELTTLCDNYLAGLVSQGSLKECASFIIASTSNAAKPQAGAQLNDAALPVPVQGAQSKRSTNTR
jgi:hypothetical protein